MPLTIESRATQNLEDQGRLHELGLRTYRLHVTHVDGQEEVREVAQPVFRVGSRPSNDLRLRDKTASRIHFQIALDSHGFQLRDLGSTNGTVVDGYRVGEIYLRAGSHIEVGRTHLRFEPLEEEARLPLSAHESFGPLLGKSAVMRALFVTLERIAPTDFTVLVEGESGTGKELVAQALHAASRRAAGPVVVFDCAAAVGTLLESELFGHEKGAFTGADRARTGALEEADGGTLLLDEIGELPLDLQPKLLRALERREIRPVGGQKIKPVDVRVVAATNRDLAAEVNRGSFRDDLYYRLAVVRIELPPLRERADDLPLLIESFVRRALPGEDARAQAVLSAITPENWQRLREFPWPGNVRELRNVVERALALADSDVPQSIDPVAGPALRLPATPRGSRVEVKRSIGGGLRPDGVDLRRPFLEQKAEIVARFEEAYLTGLLDQSSGNVSRAAAAAGIDRMYFKRLLRKYRDGR